MSIDPATIKKAGSIHVPGELLMRDVRDETETQMVILKIVTDTPLDDELFDPEQLKQKDAPPVLTD
jgi:c-di-GMP-related signal transduction protein